MIFTSTEIFKNNKFLKFSNICFRSFFHEKFWQLNFFQYLHLIAPFALITVVLISTIKRVLISIGLIQ